MLKKILSLKNGFTLVELMIVIVIIGVLTTLIIVSLDNTKMTARNVRRLADIKQIQLALKMYYNDTGTFPTSITPGSSISKGGANYMLRVPSSPKPWPDNGCPDEDYKYTPLEGGKRYMLSFCLGDTTDDLSKGSHIATSNGILNCPTGYIPVPGSAELETNDFCVMKYEAKCALNSTATSGLFDNPTSSNTYNNDNCTSGKVAASFVTGLSIGNVSQEQAKAHCSAIGGSLITNAQWMTIARNIEQVDSNWSGPLGVGDGQISRGHHAYALNTAMPDGSASNGTGGPTNPYYRRALTLLSGDTIIDFSGNLAEWVDNTCISGDGIGKYFKDTDSGILTTLEWNSSVPTQNLSDYERIVSGPSVSSYTSAQGIGQYTECTLSGNAFLRGGSASETAQAGIYRLYLHKWPNIKMDAETSQYLYGFRCVK